MGFSHSFLIKEWLTIQSNIIYSFENLRTLLIDKTKNGAYYLVLDDIYFEEIEKDTIINREIYFLARKEIKPLCIIKYITFNVKEKYSTKQIYDLIQVLRRDTNIIVTIFNPKMKEVFLLFVSNKDDSLLEYYIKDFLELEED